MKEKMIVEQHDLIDIDFNNRILLYYYGDKTIIRQNTLFFDQENNIIGFKDSYINIIFQSDIKVNLIDEFLKLFNIKLNENECIWLHEINFDSNLLVSTDEIIGDDNLKVVFI